MGDAGDLSLSLHANKSPLIPRRCRSRTCSFHFLWRVTIAFRTLFPRDAMAARRGRQTCRASQRHATALYYTFLSTAKKETETEGQAKIQGQCPAHAHTLAPGSSPDQSSSHHHGGAQSEDAAAAADVSAATGIPPNEFRGEKEAISGRAAALPSSPRTHTHTQTRCAHTILRLGRASSNRAGEQKGKHTPRPGNCAKKSGDIQGGGRTE